jgi:choline dehydrogenase-like flavoprotein
MQIAVPTSQFDAVVVGSGATGGWAAKKLTEAGMKVCLLEAGKNITPKDYKEHTETWELPYLGLSPKIRERRPVQSKCYACREWNYDWFADDIDNPYVQAKPFSWIRQRVLGGRSNSWGRQSYRIGDIDFKAASRDGYGMDWPISYADLVPYYEEVEKYVGISGEARNLEQLPDSIFQPPMKMTCVEEHFRKGVEAKTGRAVTIGRVAILTKGLNGRAPCHYCGPCEHGCRTNSYFNSPQTTIRDAGKTGKLTLMTDAVAAKITTKGNRATGVIYIDSNTNQEREIKAKIVILCASTLESTRLCMNSGLFGDNLAMGRFLMDHAYEGGATASFDLPKGKLWTGWPKRPNGIYMPRFVNVKEIHTNGMIRGYGYQGGGSFGYNMNAPGFGKDYKGAIHNGGWYMSLGAWVESLPRLENNVSIDPEKKDKWGIPALKISMEWSDNEKKLFEHAREQAAEMLSVAGGKNARKTGTISTPGHCIHEVGTMRMGNDKRTSVFNKYAQAHDMPNLFCTDGAVWVSQGCQNPTLTMMAITVRTMDYIKREAAKNLI